MQLLTFSVINYENEQFVTLKVVAFNTHFALCASGTAE